MSRSDDRRGRDGLPGLRGKAGPEGQRGPEGPQGPIGQQGPQGDQGPAGPEGQQGPAGVQGPVGPPGKPGVAGAPGNRGEAGPQGQKGTDGDTGPIGPMPQHQWDGTRLRFQQALDVWGQWVDLRGPAGEKGLTQAYYGAVDPAGGGGIGEAPIDGSPYWRKDGAWALAITGGSATWGAITGNIADQTDLKTALDAKAATSSLATVATTGAYSDLTGKPTLGTAAAAATTDFATAAQGATADAAEPASHAAATYATITNLALKAPLASPTFTGTVTIPTPSGGDNSTKAASTAFVVAGFAPIASPTFTGTPVGPTAAVGTDTTQFASTAFVQAAVTAIVVTSKSADYTLVLADKGSAIYHPSTDANGRTFTIPANSSVAYAVGTTLTFVNMSANALSIAITSDTMNLAGAGSTGTRTLAQYGTATAVKLASTLWLISGLNLT